MVWETIFFNRMITRKEFDLIITEIFKISNKEILYICDLSELLGADPNIKIICQCYMVNIFDEFCLRVDFTIRDKKIIPENDMKVFSMFSEMLKCKLMVEAYSEIPSKVLIINCVNIDYNLLEDAENILLK